ncbi:MAG: hypothetical protein IPM29_21210 [Planctomycetes bacterium]|nr:hypothetical protein [Planctomycetota bacterium]
MRALLGIAVLILVAVGALLALRDDAAAPGPAPAPTEDSAPGAAPPVTGPARRAAAEPIPAPEAVPAAPPAATPPQPAQAAAGAGAPAVTVALRVVSARDRTPLAGFVVAPLDPIPALPIERAVGDHRVELAIDPGRPGRVRIEAAEFLPSAPVDLAAAAAAGQAEVVVELVPALRGTGVLLLVRDDRLEPVGRLRVVAFRRPLGSPDSAEEQAWSRFAEREDGAYELPDLEPAAWRFELTALDAAGEPRPLVTADVSAPFDGGGRIERAVDLAPGALLSLAVRDPATGGPLGPTVALRLQTHDAAIVPTRFVHRSADGVTTAVDTLPVADRCALDRALPPGDYVLLTLADGAGEPWRTPFRATAGARIDLSVP